jgi:histidinol-phosphate phosphatase family protein
MVATSSVMPFWAVAHRAAGWIRVAALRRAGVGAPLATAPPPARARGAAAGRRRDPPAAVLLDRDGTLIEDVPYNGDRERVRPRPGAFEALEALRAAGVRLAVVSNQSGVGRGLISLEQVRAVNRRVEELLGPLGPWLICPHAPAERCECRKPRPGLVIGALARLGVSPDRCAMIGDIGADVQAARAARVRAVLVPTQQTLAAELRAAPELAISLPAAVARLLGERR